MVVAAFSVENKANQVRFFEKTFLVANIRLEVVFEIPFLTFSGADINFLDREFWWRTYITKKALPVIRRIKFVGKKEFATTVLDPEYEIFVVYIALFSVAFFNSTPLDANVHLFYRPQIYGLIAKNAPPKVFTKYLDFADIFSLDLAFELSKHTKINNHAIKLIDGQQLSYRPTYSLELVELEMLKAYIETNLDNKFIRPSKSPPVLPSSLIRSQMVFSIYASIIKVSIIS